MTKEKREQLSNMLVLNFGLLLLGALIMLYVNSYIKSVHVQITYTLVLILGIASLVCAVAFFIIGKKKPKAKKYSAPGLGVFVAAAIIYASKFDFADFYTKSFAVVSVYILMLVYFLVLSIYVFIMMRKPLIKDPLAVAKAQAIKKNKKRKKKNKR